ncbi:MAG: hypothetical protein JNM27_11410 [Leptospirales bacterium]|nr:hypothetical protein [Leptospirales bacterium]
MRISLLHYLFMSVIACTSWIPTHATEACKTTEFKTKGYKEACIKGGQKAAKDFAKSFLKNAMKTESGLNCNSCHTKLAPDYPLKPDAVTRFQSLGGQLLVARPAQTPSQSHKPAKPQKAAESDPKKSKTGEDCAEKKKEPPRAGQGCSIN